VVPMLPFELSADACSLKEGQDRMCLAVSMEFDKAGTKRSHEFMRAVMRSAASLSYEVAQQAIDAGALETDGAHPLGDRALYETVLKPLWGAYGALKAARARRAPLELDLPERKVEIGPDGTVAGIREKARFDAHKLIEEMMIQANVAAAETLEAKGCPLLYRVHDSPSDAKVAALAEFLKTLDVKWPVGQKTETARFNRLLLDFEDTENAEAVSEIVLRSQSQAIYSPENIGHFGLNLKKYAHFTSPIRRYSDLIVHRALVRIMNAGPDGLTDKQAAQLEEIAEHIVTTERRSMAAEREATDRYLALYLADRVGATFHGRITGVTKAGVFVRLEETGADGFSPASRISDEYWHYSESEMALVAERSGKRYEMGQAVEVRLDEVTPLEGGLLLELISDPKPARAGHKPMRRGRPSGHRSRFASAPNRGKGKTGKRGKKRR
ncbi:MAG: RNB domain-containing ribonuclease, partial [Pseudomonadota bacterium]